MQPSPPAPVYLDAEARPLFDLVSFDDNLKALLEQGLIVKHGNTIRLTSRGSQVLNGVQEKEKNESAGNNKENNSNESSAKNLADADGFYVEG
jgi:superfamily II helicase